MLCKRCRKGLTGRQTSYCSQICGKLHLKSLYKKRNREKINSYNRDYRAFKRRAENTRGEVPRYRHTKKGECERCGSKKKLTLDHIIPLSAGGVTVPENLRTLCLTCNIREYRSLVRRALRFYFRDKIKKLTQLSEL